ncbi:unnamed protein product [Lymnaea stagnalis]|uniref:Uncharacterized protein n=1 Tax=Lymnaea stagnalis TaxID=6523 RepID=A0AAV2HG13_LYMST
MPRSHVSVARFYDWSEDIGGCFSVSQLYREMAAIPSQLPERPPRCHGSVDHATTPRHVTSGRMFLRDKKTLTRGEREIIEGIYKNRGDVTGRDITSKAEHHAKSHHDAWLTDRTPSASNLHRVLVRGEKIDGRPLKAFPLLDTNILSPSSTSDASKPASPDSVHVRAPANKQHHDAAPAGLTHHKPPGGAYKKSGDSELAVPPCSPNDSNPNSPIHFVHTFDKLLTLRQTVPTNSIVFADRFSTAINAGHSRSSNHIQAANMHDDTSPNTKRESLETISPLKPRPQADDGACDNNQTNYVTKALNSHLLSIEDYNKMCGTAQWLLNNGDDVDKGHGGSDQGVRDIKKVSVQVFIPTAEPDVGEEDASTTTSLLLSRERPLSHRTFKTKQIEPSMTDVCVDKQ